METIDEAARKYGCDAYIEYCRQHGVDASTAKYPNLEQAFKAGALWMAKQHADEISECTEKDAQQRLDDSGYNIE